MDDKQRFLVMVGTGSLLVFLITIFGLGFAPVHKWLDTSEINWESEKSNVDFDNDKDWYKWAGELKKNAEKIVGPNYEFFQTNVFDFIKHCSQYDLIYADPPYGKYDLRKLVEYALKKLREHGKFFLECEKQQEPFLDCSMQDYGQTRLLLWEK